MIKYEKIAENIRDAKISDLKQEFREFKREVRRTLGSFRIIAIEGMKVALETTNKCLDYLEKDVRVLRDRIDKVREELTARIDETNARIDLLMVEIGNSLKWISYIF